MATELRRRLAATGMRKTFHATKIHCGRSQLDASWVLRFGGPIRKLTKTLDSNMLQAENRKLSSEEECRCHYHWMTFFQGYGQPTDKASWHQITGNTPCREVINRASEANCNLAQSLDGSAECANANHTQFHQRQETDSRVQQMT